MHPQCGPCEALLPDLSQWQRAYSDILTIALMSEGGGVNDNRDNWTKYNLRHVLQQRTTEISQQYKAYGTPSAVLIWVDGTIASPVASGADAIRVLLGRSVTQAAIPSSAPGLDAALRNPDGNGHHHSVPILKPGDPLPPLTLRDLNGSTVPLSAFLSQDSVILFWNPTCRFCQEMLEDLKAWDANTPETAPRLVVVSTGTVEAGRAMGLRSPVLLDLGNQASSIFGATGTPMGVLLNGSRVRSGVVAGAQAVFALLNTAPAKAFAMNT